MPYEPPISASRRSGNPLVCRVRPHPHAGNHLAADQQVGESRCPRLDARGIWQEGGTKSTGGATRVRSGSVRDLFTQPATTKTEAVRAPLRMFEPPDAPMSRIAYRNFRKSSTDERDVRSPHSRPRACPPSGALFVCLSKDRANRHANAWPSRWPRLSTKSPAVAFLRDQGEGTTKSCASHWESIQVRRRPKGPATRTGLSFSQGPAISIGAN